MTAELRAIEVLERVPSGCTLFLIRNDAHAPHLRAGEFAVIDPRDQEYSFGELYLVEWSGGSRSVRQIKRQSEGVWFLPLARPTLENVGGMGAGGQQLYCGDGPLRPEYLPQYLRGRVIGVYQGPEIGGA